MKGAERRRIVAAIDMTPLMDLTFMLLIIFVITVPSMYYKSDVTLTPPESTTNDKMEIDDKSLFVELDKDGQIWLGNGENHRSQSIPGLADLTAELTKRKQELDGVTVFLVGDKERKYQEVIEIANAVQRAGIYSLSLVFNPEGTQSK
ncbi:MAG: biopolymer transporter ExbD [Victivallales bacterium]|nr:biopolymer transporter ExbD [Victivallales bacterium]